MVRPIPRAEGIGRVVGLDLPAIFLSPIHGKR